MLLYSAQGEPQGSRHCSKRERSRAQKSQASHLQYHLDDDFRPPETLRVVQTPTGRWEGAAADSLALHATLLCQGQAHSSVLHSHLDR